MDLDTLKREWQTNESFKKEVKDSMIKEMIANRNKGAFERIKRYEREALRVLPITSIAFVFVSASILMHGDIFGICWVLAMLPIGAGLWYWSYWLCGFLDKIDMSRMTVTEVSRSILKYRTYLIRHTILAGILMPTYLGVWVYCFFKANHGLDGVYSVEFLVVYLSLALVFFFVIIWFRYFRHIRDIQRNLRELEEFEQDNQ